MPEVMIPWIDSDSGANAAIAADITLLNSRVTIYIAIISYSDIPIYDRTPPRYSPHVRIPHERLLAYYEYLSHVHAQNEIGDARHV